MSSRYDRRCHAVVLAIALCVGACSDSGSSAERAHWSLERTSGDEKALQVAVVHRACDRFSHVDVDEAADEVSIVAYVEGGHPPAVAGVACSDDIALEESVTVRLDAPLGGRSLSGCTVRDAGDCRE